MSDYSTLTQRLSKVNGDQLVAMLAHPSLEDDAMLRAYFGPETYRRLRSLALRCQIIRDEAGYLRDERPRNHVIIVPGMLGSELRSVDDADKEEGVWLSGHNIASGALMKLRLAEDGLRPAETGYKIEVNGLVTRIYAELMLFLAQRFEVHTFSYDWRRSFRTAADDLQVYLNRDFSADDIVYLVAHAEGGLVTRLHQAKYPEYWKTHRGKLILLGTPFPAPSRASRRWQAISLSPGGQTFWTGSTPKPTSWQWCALSPASMSCCRRRTFFPQREALYQPQTYGPEVNRKLLAEAERRLAGYWTKTSHAAQSAPSA